MWNTPSVGRCDYQKTIIVVGNDSNVTRSQRWRSPAQKVVIPCPGWCRCHLWAARRSDRRPIDRRTNRDEHWLSATAYCPVSLRCDWTPETPARHRITHNPPPFNYPVPGNPSSAGSPVLFRSLCRKRTSNNNRINDALPVTISTITKSKHSTKPAKNSLPACHADSNKCIPVRRNGENARAVLSTQYPCH